MLTIQTIQRHSFKISICNWVYRVKIRPSLPSESIRLRKRRDQVSNHLSLVLIQEELPTYIVVVRTTTDRGQSKKEEYMRRMSEKVKGDVKQAGIYLW